MFGDGLVSLEVNEDLGEHGEGIREQIFFQKAIQRFSI